MERPDMAQITNGMLATLLHGAAWRKSSYSNPCGECVELANLTNGEIAVRNSRHPSGPVLIFTRAEMAAFIQDAKEGALDEMTG
jgi:uncharacterized protein DUF397